VNKDWTPQELQAVSTAMKAAGEMSYEEFCIELERQTEETEQNRSTAPGNEF
jgi:hypothetical protein